MIRSYIAFLQDLTARDFKQLKHNCKRFALLKNLIKRLPMLKNLIKRFLFKQNYKEICLRLNTWYTISGVHNTNQIQISGVLRYGSCKEILSELWWGVISTEFWHLYLVVWVLQFSMFSLIYIEVLKRRCIIDESIISL